MIQKLRSYKTYNAKELKNRHSRIFNFFQIEKTKRVTNKVYKRKYLINEDKRTHKGVNINTRAKKKTQGFIFCHSKNETIQCD